MIATTDRYEPYHFQTLQNRTMSRREGEGLPKDINLPPAQQQIDTSPAICRLWDKFQEKDRSAGVI